MDVRRTQERAHAAALGVGLEQRAAHRAELAATFPAHQRVVQRGEQSARGDRSSSASARQRVARETRDRGRFGTLAAHVADDEPPRLAVDLEHVVEVAADLVALARGAVAGRDARARDLRERRRQQARLQGTRDVIALGVQAGVVEREPGPAARTPRRARDRRTETPTRSRRYERESNACSSRQAQKRKRSSTRNHHFRFDLFTHHNLGVDFES